MLLPKNVWPPYELLSAVFDIFQIACEGISSGYDRSLPEYGNSSKVRCRSTLPSL
ncbi:MAG: hypothetical protein J5603_05665 [Bacteroidales bacterium]|nr:hypothetical protein [Bacteroidales bacterium]